MKLPPLTKRNIALLAALLLALALTLWGDSTPESNIAQPVARPLRAGSGNNVNNGNGSSNGNASASIPNSNAATASGTPISIALLIDRKELLGAHQGESELVEARPGLKLKEAKSAQATGSITLPPDERPERLFAAHSWTPPPPPPPPPGPPPAPVAPPLPFSYIGKKWEDQHWEVYLARGEQTIIARENSRIDGVYQIERIAPPTLTLTYLPLRQIQTLSIGGSD